MNGASPTLWHNIIKAGFKKIFPAILNCLLILFFKNLKPVGAGFRPDRFTQITNPKS
jgi:hypothetical protein